MNYHIVLRELRANLKSLLLWSGIMLMLVAGGMSKYVGFQSSGEDVVKLLDNLPEAVKSMVGMGSFDLTTATGFLAVMFLYFAIMVAIHGGVLGATLVVKEEMDRTADFLLVKPMKRELILVSKFVAGVINLLILNAVTSGISFAVLTAFEPDKDASGFVIKMIFALLGVQMVFFALGFGLGCGIKQYRKSAGIVASITLTAFLLSIAIDINKSIDHFEFLTPFKYFDAKDVFAGDGFSVPYILLSAIIIIVSVAAGVWRYRSKDIV